MTASTIPAGRGELRGAGAFTPLLRSEIRRVSHRRFYRVCSLLLLAGIVVVSAIVFFHSDQVDTIPPAAQQAYDRELAREQSYYAQCQQQAESQQQAAIDVCGPPPEESLSVYDFAGARPYQAKEALLPVVISVSVASAMLAFLIGASVGGAEWSSRSMTLQMLWEPRRLRLLVTKWLGLAVVMTLTGAANLAVGLGLGALTTSLRGTWAGLPADFWGQLIGASARGLVLILFATTVAYAISMLVRNTGGSLGVAFVYFAVAELGIRASLSKFGPDRYLLSGNVAAWMSNHGVDIPGRVTQDDQGNSSLSMVHLSNVHGLMVMSAFLVVVVIPAAWSFKRRDVG
ncbi:MAG: ABC transporter permease subunit [Actinomycetes bacterium]